MTRKLFVAMLILVAMLAMISCGKKGGLERPVSENISTVPSNIPVILPN